jgi:hypothetical protein
MPNMIFATGKKIYQAAIAGAAQGYNRSTDDHHEYERALCEHYREMLKTVKNRATRRGIQKSIGNDWRRAYFPLSLALLHKHKGGLPCETHARVYLCSNPGAVFDIPMSHWEELKKACASNL